MKGSRLFLRGRNDGLIRKVAVLSVVLCALGAVWAGVRAQALSKAAASASSPAASSSEKNIPPRPAEACCGYPFPRSTDAEIADSDVHRVYYEDAHVMLIEVNNPPLLHVRMHGHPFTSVFAHDSSTGGHNPAAPDVPRDQIDLKLDPTSGYNNMAGSNAPPPAGMKWPTCNSAAPQAPHQGPFDTNRAPNHFYRIEFLRAEGDDLAAHWKEWYPETRNRKNRQDLTPGPSLGPKFSEKWPSPIVYDEIQAAPSNYKLLFEDGKLRFVEVTVRPGETTPMAGSPYPTIMAYNGNLSDPSTITETWLDPNSPLNGQGQGHSGPPKLYNLKSPTCGTSAPEAPHKIHNGGTVLLHYYRLEYKRIDGDELATKWQEWYPWMKYMQFMR